MYDMTDPRKAGQETVLENTHKKRERLKFNGEDIHLIKLK